ncbi:MAG: hypothetical protein MI808_14685 [Pseudomonadales bacterium]|nr:hypothetical protein [Pseudomonadales bacterium]
MAFYKFVSVIVIGLSLLACGGGGSSSGPSPNRNATPNPNTNTPDPNNPDPNGPGVVASNNFAFFPIVDGSEWHFDNGDVVTLGDAISIEGVTVRPLVHSSPAWASQEYFLSDDEHIYFSGMFSSILDLSALGLGVGSLDGQIQLNAPWKMYTPKEDKGWGGFLSFKSAMLTVYPGEYEAPITLNPRSSVVDKTALNVSALGMVPALQLNIKTDLLYQVAPIGSVDLNIWLAPGLGIIARQVGADPSARVTLSDVVGLSAPVVFIFDQGNAISQGSHPLTWYGDELTDNQLQAAVEYATEQEDWLNVEYTSGRWQVSLLEELPTGLHAAVVTLTGSAQSYDVVVSVLVE